MSCFFFFGSLWNNCFALLHKRRAIRSANAFKCVNTLNAYMRFVDFARWCRYRLNGNIFYVTTKFVYTFHGCQKENNKFLACTFQWLALTFDIAFFFSDIMRMIRSNENPCEVKLIWYFIYVVWSMMSWHCPPLINFSLSTHPIHSFIQFNSFESRVNVE